jgi:hypothetical protein
MIKYSQSTSGFYRLDVHGSSMPHDAKEITHEQYAALLDGQAQGKSIVQGDDGNPKLQDAPPSADHELIGGLWQISQAKVQARFIAWRKAQLSAFRLARDDMLNQIVGIAFFGSEAGDSALVSACAAARSGLLSLPQQPAVVAATDEAAYSAAIKAAYILIAAAAPSTLKAVLASFKV